MTDFNPFSAVPEDAAMAPLGPEQEQESRGNAKLLVGLGALAAVAVGAGAFLLLSGGDDVEDLGVVAAAPRAAAPAASPAPSIQAKLPPQANLTLGRNPFRPLYVEPAPAPPPAPALPTSVDSPGTTVVVVGGGMSGPGAEPVPQQPTAQEHKLVLLRVFGTGQDQSASFSIDGKQQTAKVGTTFGPTAEILLLSLQEGPKKDSWTAVLQVGDGDPFDVLMGEPVFVR